MADKLKMSQKKFMLILIPILAILLGTVIAVTAVMNWAKVTMDSFFGKGQQHIIDLEGTEDWTPTTTAPPITTARRRPKPPLPRPRSR